MDGLIHAAVEAESILNRAKHVNSSLTQFESGVVDPNLTWNHDKVHLSETVDESRSKFHRNSMGSSGAKSSEKFDLLKKLHELHNNLNRDESLKANYQGLQTTSYLLEKLLVTYNLNTLIINLYPGNKGYSLALKINGNMQQLNPSDVNHTVNQDENLMETPRWPYEEEELLSYIDNEELPVVLLDLLETEHSSLFYSGCIIAQIRDYRQAYPSFLCDTHHVLLKPTTQSIITDAMCIGGRCGWTSEDRAAFEAALVMATAPPLCLDPRPAVGFLAARLHSTSRLFNTPHIRRQARRFSQVAVNRKRKLDQFTHYHGLELLEFIHRQRAKISRQSVPLTRLSSRHPKKPSSEALKPIEPPKMEPLPLKVPTDPVAPMKFARAYERPRPSPDCQPQLVEEYVLETEKNTSHTGTGYFHIKLSILQRPSDQEFLGELYVDRDYVEGQTNGASCRFSLGTRVHANKYIQQFTEIFTEEGRKSVRIKHIVPGQQPRVSFTAGMREIQGQLLQQRAASTASTAQVTVPAVVTSAKPATSNSHTAGRSLPILAQIQCAGVNSVAAVTGVPTVAGNSDALKQQQQPSPGTPRLSPQVHEIHSSQTSTNQLLTQQLTNPPQPLNPQKMQQAIIHIQHPLISTAGTSQVQSIQYTTTTSSQPKPTMAKPRTTNPAISALVTSLMNSAQQFQQAASQNAAKSAVSTATSNATILNLLNSAPAAMTHPTTTPVETIATPVLDAPGTHKSLLGRTVSIAGARLIATVTTATHTVPVPSYSHQVMAGYSCDNEATNVSSSESGLLERLIAGPSDTAEPETAQSGPSQPQQMPATQALHLQGLSLTSLQGLQGIQGVQNVHVQIPGIPQPISLQLNVSAPSGLLVSVPPTTSVVLTNQPSVLSLPIAQLMSSSVKGGVRSGVQLVRSRAPTPRPMRPGTPSSTLQSSSTGSPQYITQGQTINTHQVRRKSNPSDNS